MAADVYRCAGADGGTVFSEQPCGPDAEKLSIDAHERIGGAGEDAPNAIEQLRNYRRNVRDIEELVGGEDAPAGARTPAAKNPCARVTSLQLRNARVGKDIVRCHRQADVRAILGEPDAVYTWSDNKAHDTRWTFHRGNTSHYVYFKRGRVTRVNTRRSAE